MSKLILNYFNKLYILQNKWTMILFVTVFPQEYVNPNNNANCEKNSTHSLGTYIPSPTSLDNNITSHVTASGCELYCASEKSCCGCKKVCDKKCKWNMITNCEQRKDPKPYNDQCLSEKPGNMLR